ncbi:MAG: winged helix-turn-helix domain-containing protein [Hyphomicrobiaceae bacterium]
MPGTPVNNTRLRIRLYFSSGSMFGPGKADLLALISETGSIAAAGRRLGMSYKRAWGLVETMNTMFAEPLVESSRGGASHGGATVTAMGVRVLALYRSLEANTRSGSASEIASLERMLAPQNGEASDTSVRN